MPSVMFRRTRFLARVVMSSPVVVFAYSPLLVVQTFAGIAIPFATGRFIDALVERIEPIGPFAVLAALLIARAVLRTIKRELANFYATRNFTSFFNTAYGLPQTQSTHAIGVEIGIWAKNICQKAEGIRCPLWRGPTSSTSCCYKYY